MKNIILLVLISFIGINSNAQEGEISTDLTVLERFPSIKNRLSKIIGNQNEGMVAMGLNSYAKKPMLYYFDSKMNFINSGLATVKGKTISKTDLVNIYSENNQVYFLSYKYNKKLKSRSIEKYTLDVKTMSFVNPEPFMMWENSLKISGLAYSHFLQATSKDSMLKVFLTYGNKTPEGGREVIVTVTDSENNVKWEKHKYIKGETSAGYTVTDIKIGNNGKVYILRSKLMYSYYNGVSTAEVTEFQLSNFEMIIIQESKDFVKIPLVVNGMSYGKGYMSFMNEEEIRIVFNYRATDKSNIGVYAAFIDLDLDELNSSEETLFDYDKTTAFLSEDELKSAEKKKNNGYVLPFTHYTIESEIFNTNGSTTLIMEQHFNSYVSESIMMNKDYFDQTKDGRGSRKSRNAYAKEKIIDEFGNILIVNMDEEGSVVWTKVIAHKTRIYKSKLGIHATPFQLENGDISIMFFDSYNFNAQNDTEFEHRLGEDENYLIYTMNNDKVYDRSVLDTEEKVYLNGSVNYPLGKNEFLLNEVVNYEEGRFTRIFIDN
jgi:hypothetical protein